MVKVYRRVIGMKVVCSSCRTVLEFQKEDMKDCNSRHTNACGFSTEYMSIDCPVCGKELVVWDAKFKKWENNVDMIYEKKEENNDKS